MFVLGNMWIMIPLTEEWSKWLSSGKTKTNRQQRRCNEERNLYTIGQAINYPTTIDIRTEIYQKIKNRNTIGSNM